MVNIYEKGHLKVHLLYLNFNGLLKLSIILFLSHVPYVAFILEKIKTKKDQIVWLSDPLPVSGPF